VSDDSTYTLDEIVERTGFDKRTTSYYVQKGLLPKVGRRGPKTRYPQVFLDRLMFIKMIREQQDRGEIDNLTLANIRDLLDQVRPETIADMVNGRDSPKKIDALKAAQAMAAQASTADTPDQPTRSDQQFVDEFSDVIEVLINDMWVDSGSADADVEPPSPPVHQAEALPAEPPVVEEEPAEAIPAEPVVAKEEPADAPADNSPKHQEYDGAMVSEGTDDAEPRDGFPQFDEDDRLGWALANLQRAVDVPRRNRGTTESWHRARITPELTISARNLRDHDAHRLDAVARMLKQLLWRSWEE
jgi:DNA-binding transcriptional MerR regulator